MGIQARHQHQLLATRLDELLASAITDLLQRLDTVGDERRAHHQQLLHALLGQFVQARLGVGFDPLGTPQSRLERHRPLIPAQPGTRSEALGSADALGAVASGEHGTFGTLAAVVTLQAMRPGRIGLVQVPPGSPWKLSSR